MEKSAIESLPELFKAMAHPIRVKLVMGLMQNEGCNVTKMVKNLEISQPSVSQHLIILKSAGIIEGYRKGKQICYKVVNKHVKVLINSIIEYELIKNIDKTEEL